MAKTTHAAVGGNSNLPAPFIGNVRKDHPMAIPSGCVCTWVVKPNRIWVLKYQSAMCLYRDRH
jgi:hypothetical protein